MNRKEAQLAIAGFIFIMFLAVFLLILMLQIPKVNAGEDLQAVKEDCKDKGCFEGTEDLNITYQMVELGDRAYTPFCIFDPDTVEQNAYLEYFTSWEEDVPEYECTVTGQINETSGEYLEECIQIGSHKETKEGWLRLEEEQILEKGDDIYLSVTSGDCHLPFKLKYSGSLSPSDIIIDSSLLTSNFNFAPDRKAVDVIPSIKIGESTLLMSKMAWWNQSDGFSTLSYGADSPGGLTSNGTDWWINDYTDESTYHLNSNLQLLDTFSTAANCRYARGLCVNSTTLIYLSDDNDKVCFYDHKGVFKNTMSISAATTDTWMNNLDCNETDIWISAGGAWSQLAAIYHFGSTGQNMSDAISTEVYGCAAPRGSRHNGSDTWVACGNASQDVMYHFDKYGQNVTEDGFSLVVEGITEPGGMSSYPTADNSTGFIFTDLWVVDQVDAIVYHFYQPPTFAAANESEGDEAILQGIANSTINPATTYSNQQIYTVNVTGQHQLARFDVLAVSGSQRWAFNYVSENESTSNFTYMVNITPALYIWEATNLTYGNISEQVTVFINSTKI